MAHVFSSKNLSGNKSPLMSSTLVRIMWMLAACSELFICGGMKIQEQTRDNRGYNSFMYMRGALELPRTFVLLMGIGAAIPRGSSKSVFSEAGAGALRCYLLHMLVAPALHPYPFFFGLIWVVERNVRYYFGDSLGWICHGLLIVGYMLCLQVVLSRPLLPARQLAMPRALVNFLRCTWQEGWRHVAVAKNYAASHPSMSRKCAMSSLLIMTIMMLRGLVVPEIHLSQSTPAHATGRRPGT